MRAMTGMRAHSDAPSPPSLPPPLSDEFNRITLPVLSVVAQQVLAINNAKKAGLELFQFPGDPQTVKLEPACGFFITMNPGYAGRQELPENLKAQFRGVAMMVPDREIIMKVKLCSVGYSEFNTLSRKFFVCYQLAEQQLSKQKHYDFGLRNILSVLRTAGATKRENLGADEETLLYRTLRDMNLSKLVAQDVPLFLSMLADLFPALAPPPKREYPSMEAAIRASITESKLIMHPSWVNKVIQLHETCLVRHGIMLTGTAGSGKSKIIETLQAALVAVEGRQYKTVRLNPKAVQVRAGGGGAVVEECAAALWRGAPCDDCGRPSSLCRPPLPTARLSTRPPSPTPHRRPSSTARRTPRAASGSRASLPPCGRSTTTASCPTRPGSSRMAPSTPSGLRVRRGRGGRELACSQCPARVAPCTYAPPHPAHPLPAHRPQHRAGR